MIKKTRHHRSSKQGFTLIELMVSLVVLTMLALFSGRLYLNYTSTARDLKAVTLVNEEARFLMERLVREIRQNAVDYEEYFNQNVMIPFTGYGDYGKNYCAYSNFFYDDKGESIGVRNDTQTAAITAAFLNPEAVRSVEPELYLINLAGLKRTFIKRIVREVSGEQIGKVSMVRMRGYDFGEDHINRSDSYNGGGSSEPGCLNTIDDRRENDGLIDTWLCVPDFPCTRDTTLNADIYGTGCLGYTDTADDDHGFVDISPNALNVLDLKFMIAPEDDPWKAYNMNDVQFQPHITIQLTAEANPKLVNLGDASRIPSITLTSTITARNYDEVISDCTR